MQNLGRLLRLRRSKLEGCARIVEGLDPNLSRQGQETSYNSQKRGQKPPSTRRRREKLQKVAEETADVVQTVGERRRR